MTRRIVNFLVTLLPRALVGRFARDTGILALGVILAHAISLAAIPIITRLFTPQEFGVFSNFAALVGTVGAFACLYFEAAIPLAKNAREATCTLAISLMATATITCGCILAVMMLGNLIVSILNVPELRTILWLFPLNVALIGIFQGCSYWVLTKKYFSTLSGSRIGQSLSVTGVQIFAGMSSSGSAGLIHGQVFGQLIATSIVGAHVLRSLWELLKSPAESLATIATCARRYRELVLFGSWGTLMVSAAYQVVPVVLSSMYGPVTAGIYFISYRVGNVPVALLGSSMSQVMLQRAAERVARGQPLADLVERMLSTLIQTGVIPFLLLAIFAPSAFSLAFGREWQSAGEFFRILAPLFFLQYLTVPVSAVMIALQKQKVIAKLQTAMLIGAMLSLLAGYVYFGTPTASLTLYVVTECAIYCVYLGVILSCSSASGRRIIKALVNKR